MRQVHLKNAASYSCCVRHASEDNVPGKDTCRKDKVNICGGTAAHATLFVGRHADDGSHLNILGLPLPCDTAHETAATAQTRHPHMNVVVAWSRCVGQVSLCGLPHLCGHDWPRERERDLPSSRLQARQEPRTPLEQQAKPTRPGINRVPDQDPQVLPDVARTVCSLCLPVSSAASAVPGAGPVSGSEPWQGGRRLLELKC